MRERPPETELTARESVLLNQAGDRVFDLARRLSAAQREQERLASDIRHLTELIDETRRTRDVLSAQVMSLQNERERDYQERAELRQLLAAMTAQLALRPPLATDSRIELDSADARPPASHVQLPVSAGRAGRIKAQKGALGGMLSIARRGVSRRSPF